MYSTRIEMQQVEVPAFLQCDRCKTVYSYDVPEHQMEIQEFLCISRECGYASIFGDGNLLKVDLCQHCQNEIFAGLAVVEG